jgi:hypothetical protein
MMFVHASMLPYSRVRFVMTISRGTVRKEGFSESSVMAAIGFERGTYIRVPHARHQ